jgi:hypothetical protein
VYSSQDWTTSAACCLEDGLRLVNYSCVFELAYACFLNYFLHEYPPRLDFDVLCCDAVWSGRWLSVFWRNLLPPSSILPWRWRFIHNIGNHLPGHIVS